MRRIRVAPRSVRVVAAAALTLAVAVAITATSVSRLAATQAHASRAHAPALAEESPCVPEVDKYAHPPVVLLGETVDITLTVRAVCAVEPFPLHIVLVLDASVSMAGTLTQMKQAASDLVRGLEMDQYPSTKVGVVEFNSTSRTLSQLTNDEQVAIRAINRVGASSGTRIDAGIQEGILVMQQGRGQIKDVVEMMVVFSDGGNDGGCYPVTQAARQARAQGILMITVCLGSVCDEQCMRQVASSPRYYFRAENAADLTGVCQYIQQRVLNINLRKLVVKDTLSEFMRYVPDSADPEQSSPATPSQWLQWDDWYIPRDGMTYTLRVLPLVSGYMPTNEEAWGELIDGKGRRKEWTFPVPWVTVLQPRPLATPPTPPPTPTLTITPTPRPKPVFLPVLLRDP